MLSILACLLPLVYLAVAFQQTLLWLCECGAPMSCSTLHCSWLKSTWPTEYLRVLGVDRHEVLVSLALAANACVYDRTLKQT